MQIISKLPSDCIATAPLWALDSPPDLQSSMPEVTTCPSSITFPMNAVGEPTGVPRAVCWEMPSIPPINAIVKTNNTVDKIIFLAFLFFLFTILFSFPLQ